MGKDQMRLIDASSKQQDKWSNQKKNKHLLSVDFKAQHSFR